MHCIVSWAKKETCKFHYMDICKQQLYCISDLKAFCIFEIETLVICDMNPSKRSGKIYAPTKDQIFKCTI